MTPERGEPTIHHIFDGCLNCRWLSELQLIDSTATPALVMPFTEPAPELLYP